MTDATTKLLLGFTIVLLALLLCNRVNPPEMVPAQPELFSWGNAAGDQVASVKGVPEDLARVQKRLLDSMARVYNVREKDLMDLFIAQVEGEADVPPVPGHQAADYFPPQDSCPPQVRNLRDSFATPYYQAQVQIGDSSYMRLHTQDTVTGVWKEVREGGWFNRRQLLQLDISFADTSRRVTGLKAYRKLVKPKRWGLAVFAGWGAGPKGAGAVGGIGLSYHIIQF